MVGEHAIYNGRVILTSEAVMPITCKEVQSGFYVYESLRIIDSYPVHLQDHLERLALSAKGIGLSYIVGDEDFTSWIMKLIEVDTIEQATLRIQMYGGPVTHVFITASKILTYPDSYYSDGVSAISYRGERLFPSSKTGNLLLNYVALEQAKRQGCFEALLFDEKNRVLEGTRSNFYAIKKNTLYTASDDLVLLGITRQRVLRSADILGLSVHYEAPDIQALHENYYDEIFISATSMAAMPLCSIDGISYGSDFKRTLAIKAQVRAWDRED